MIILLGFHNEIFYMKLWYFSLTNTGKNAQKWTRVFSTRRWVILVARTRRKKEENSVSTFGCFRLWTNLESSPLSVKMALVSQYFWEESKFRFFDLSGDCQVKFKELIVLLTRLWASKTYASHEFDKILSQIQAC